MLMVQPSFVILKLKVYFFGPGVVVGGTVGMLAYTDDETTVDVDMLILAGNEEACGDILGCDDDIFPVEGKTAWTEDLFADCCEAGNVLEDGSTDDVDTGKELECWDVIPC